MTNELVYPKGKELGVGPKLGTAARVRIENEEGCIKVSPLVEKIILTEGEDNETWPVLSSKVQKMSEQMKYNKDMSDFVNSILIDEFDIEEVDLHDEASFGDDLEVDSLDVVDLVMRIEGEFGIKISEEEYERMETLGGFKVVITEYKTRKAVGAVTEIEK